VSAGVSGYEDLDPAPPGGDNIILAPAFFFASKAYSIEHLLFFPSDLCVSMASTSSHTSPSNVGGGGVSDVQDTQNIHQVQHNPHHVRNPEIEPQQYEEAEDPSHHHDRSPSFLQRSMHAVFYPFSAGAIASLPRLSRPLRYTRRDAVPETEPDAQGNLPTVRDYHAINTLPPQVRVPKKVATPVKVEAKVWFANERSTPQVLFSPELGGC
jgi:hypothetical protein